MNRHHQCDNANGVFANSLGSFRCLATESRSQSDRIVLRRHVAVSNCACVKITEQPRSNLGKKMNGKWIVLLFMSLMLGQCISKPLRVTKHRKGIVCMQFVMPRMRQSSIISAGLGWSDKLDLGEPAVQELLHPLQEPALGGGSGMYYEGIHDFIAYTTQ